MQAPAASAKATGSIRHRGVSYAKWGYIFLLPFFIVFLIFTLFPLLSTFYYSFFEYYRSGLKEIGPKDRKSTRLNSSH